MGNTLPEEKNNNSTPRPFRQFMYWLVPAALLSSACLYPLTSDAASIADQFNNAEHHGTPLDLTKNAISDTTEGPAVVVPRKMAVESGDRNLDALVSSFFLRYLKLGSPQSGRTVVGLVDHPKSSRYFVFTNNRLVAVDNAIVDDDLLDKVRQSHGDDSLNIVFQDANGQRHHLSVKDGGTLDLTPLETITPNIQCLTAPSKLTIRWDNEQYNVTIIEPSSSFPEDGVQADWSGDCIKNSLKTNNSKISPISAEDTFYPSTENLYISDSTSVFIIPINFFSKDSVDNNGIVFSSALVQRDINSIASHNINGNAQSQPQCAGISADCAQETLDDTIISSSHKANP